MFAVINLKHGVCFPHESKQDAMTHAMAIISSDGFDKLYAEGHIVVCTVWGLNVYGDGNDEFMKKEDNGDE